MSIAPLSARGLVTSITDPVSLEIMRNPVSLSCGHSFDQRTAEMIHGAIRDGHCVNRAPCSLCRRMVTSYTTNYALREVVERLLDLQEVAVLVGNRWIGSSRFALFSIREHPRPETDAFLHFTRESGNSLIRELTFIEQSDGSSLLRIDTDEDDWRIFDAYLRRIQIRVCGTNAGYGEFFPLTAGDVRRLFQVFNIHNEIPTEYRERMERRIALMTDDSLLVWRPPPAPDFATIRAQLMSFTSRSAL